MPLLFSGEEPMSSQDTSRDTSRDRLLPLPLCDKERAVYSEVSTSVGSEGDQRGYTLLKDSSSRDWPHRGNPL